MGFFHALGIALISLGAIISSWFTGTPQPSATSTIATQEQPAPKSVTATESVSSPGTQTTMSHSESTNTAVAPTLPSGSPSLSSLPLGDGKYTTTGAKKGYIYVCHVASGGGGAQTNGSWISGNTWQSSEKISVQGSVSWPSAYVKISSNGTTRTIISNGLPTDHTTGTFPIAASDPASAIDRNPNSIKAQTINISLPANPTASATPGCIYGQVGIMTDGVVLFDGFDAEYRDAAAHEVQDSCDAHPEVTGEYHYHSLSRCIANPSVTNVIGWAYDGFPITGPVLPNGNQLHTADLDACHGLTSTVTIDGKQVTTYHYVMTEDFPYSISCFEGTSHEPRPTGGQTSGISAGSSAQGGMGGTQSGPPQAAITACTSKAAGASCSFTSPQGDTISGTCQTPPGASLACVPR